MNPPLPPIARVGCLRAPWGQGMHGGGPPNVRHLSADSDACNAIASASVGVPNTPRPGFAEALAMSWDEPRRSSVVVKGHPLLGQQCFQMLHGLRPMAHVYAMIVTDIPSTPSP